MPLASPHAAPNRSQKRSIFCASPGMWTPRRTRRNAGTMPKPLSSNCCTKAVITSSCCPRKSPTLAPLSAALFSSRKQATSSASQSPDRAFHQASGSELKALVLPLTSEARLRRSSKAAAQAPWTPTAAPPLLLLLLALAPTATPSLACCLGDIFGAGAAASRIPVMMARITPTKTSMATGRNSSREAAQASVSRHGSMTEGPLTSQSYSPKVSQTCRGVSNSQPKPPMAHWRVALQAGGHRTKPQSSAVAAGRYGRRPARAEPKKSVKRRISRIRRPRCGPANAR
mmetsp:Transcript_98085/g.293075  ORF Transcript_98085/g.293075 Transcript_98085/m.293075 type:complete len:286 (+) Transcript_98085:613-1470(+)